jgi:hypothetical protein
VSKTRIGLTQAYALHRHPQRPKRITPAMAARLFRVPRAVIETMWPRIPFCVPIYARSASSNGPHTVSPQYVQFTANPEDICTDEMIMERLKVTKEWLKEKRRKRCRNPIPAHNLGGIVRYYWPEVFAWFQSLTNKVEK